MHVEPVGELTIARGRTLTESTIDALRNAIISGQYPVGKAIPQAAIGRELGVSQGPVRDALAVLEREGLVRRTPTNRMVVARLTERDIEEALSVRAILEVMSVKLAIQHATEEDLDRMQRNVEAVAKARSTDEMIALEMKFHEQILVAGRNRQLLRQWKLIAPLVQASMMRMSVLPKHTGPDTARAHGRLLDLIRHRAEERAVRFVTVQMEELKEEALRQCAAE